MSAPGDISNASGRTLVFAASAETAAAGRPRGSAQVVSCGASPSPVVRRVSKGVRMGAHLRGQWWQRDQELARSSKRKRKRGPVSRIESDRQLRSGESTAPDGPSGSIARRDQRSWLPAKLSSLAPQAGRASRDDITRMTPHLVGAVPFNTTGMCGQVRRKNWRTPIAILWREWQLIPRPTPAAPNRFR